jgi:hypothetical protein
LPKTAVGDDKLTEKRAVDRYNETLDAGAWDYDAAANGTDEITEAYRELLRRKYARAALEQKMSTLNVWEYKRLGTPEHVLLKAGMVEIDDSRGESMMVAGPKLAGLFQNGKPPALETIATAMTDLVFADLYDKSGYLDGSGLRIRASSDLRAAGITETGLSALNKAITESANGIRVEMARSAKLRR